MADMRNALEKMDDEPMEDSEDLAVDLGAEEEEEELDLGLQEELEIDEEVLFEYPEEETVMEASEENSFSTGAVFDLSGGRATY